MEKGHGLSDLEADVNFDGEGAAGDEHGVGIDGLHQQNTVVGELGQDEDGEHSDGHLQGLVLGRLLGLDQGVDDDGVAASHDHKGEEEAQDDLQGQDGRLESGTLVAGVDHGADSNSVLLLDLAVQEFWEAERGRHHPDGEADHLAVEEPFLPPHLCSHGLCDGDVPVHADAHDEQHTAVEVHLVHAINHLAHEGLEFPLVSGGNGPEGQGGKKEKVSDGQVEQEHVGHGLHSRAIPVDQDDKAVAHGPHDEHEPVQGREEVARKLPDVAFLTEVVREVAVIFHGRRAIVGVVI